MTTQSQPPAAPAWTGHAGHVASVADCHLCQQGAASATAEHGDELEPDAKPLEEGPEDEDAAAPFFMVAPCKTRAEAYEAQGTMQVALDADAKGLRDKYSVLSSGIYEAHAPYASPAGPDPQCGTCHSKGCDEAERWPMRGTFEFGEDMLVSLLVGAREGGSNYWCRFDECPYKEVLKVGEEFGEWRLNLPASVSELVDEMDEILRVIDRAALQRGLDLLATKAPRVLASILRDDTDAEDADVFLQLCLLGEIVYG